MEKLRKIIAIAVCLTLLVSCMLACSTPEIPPSGNEGSGDGGQTPPKPCYTRDGELIYFGSYPCSVKMQSVTIPESEADKLNPKGSDGALYRRQLEQPYGGNSFPYSSGSRPVYGEINYFKYEKLQWRVLEEKEGYALLISTRVIDCRAVGNSGNNYENSDIREWLNGGFISMAFSSEEQTVLTQTEVDNGAQSTGYPDNPYACNNTLDLVWLPSHADITNPEFGFSADLTATDGNKQMRPTDYAMARGVWQNTANNLYGLCWWWLRSPANDSLACNQYATSGGSIAQINRVSQPESGVVPMIRIKL